MRAGKIVAPVAASNPESHAHVSLVNVTAVTFNVTVTMKVVTNAFCHVKRTVNRTRRATLGAIKGEVPTTAAVITVCNPEVTSKVDVEGSFCEVLNELTALKKVSV